MRRVKERLWALITRPSALVFYTILQVFIASTRVCRVSERKGGGGEGREGVMKASWERDVGEYDEIGK